ncbi:MAG: endonuclease III, partial [Alphaproteobacteria bacterium]
MNKAQVFEFFRTLHEIDPVPEGELDYHNAYTLLVAVALSAQA